MFRGLGCHSLIDDFERLFEGSADQYLVMELVLSLIDRIAVTARVMELALVVTLDLCRIFPAFPSIFPCFYLHSGQYYRI